MVDLATTKTMSKKAVDALATLSKGAASLGARAGPMMETTAPQDQQQQQSQPETSGPTLQELENALKALDSK
jgi:hypothetical protein